MNLYIVRHAWADEPDELRWPDDNLRPLTDDGKKRFAAVVKALVARDFVPTLIATSPLIRCRQTTDILAEHLPRPPRIEVLDALRPGSDLNELLTWTGEQTDQSIAWVGHSPDVSRLAAELLGDGTAALRFAKGAAACIRFDDLLHRGLGELYWLVTAKMLGC